MQCHLKILCFALLVSVSVLRSLWASNRGSGCFVSALSQAVLACLRANFTKRYLAISGGYRPETVYPLIPCLGHFWKSRHRKTNPWLRFCWDTETKLLWSLLDVGCSCLSYSLLSQLAWVYQCWWYVVLVGARAWECCIHWEMRQKTQIFRNAQDRE